MVYELAMCELYVTSVHGFCQYNSSQDIYNHFMVREVIDSADFMQEITDKERNDIFHNNVYENFLRYVKTQWSRVKKIDNPLIRNINNIVKKPNYIKIDIVQIIVLPKGEDVAILKTFWLRILQRRYKKYFSEKQKYIIKMKNPKQLHQRRLLGNTNHFYLRECV